jgi:periplasmic divalent cation tolerance protein
MRGYCILARKPAAHKIRMRAVARVKAIVTDKIVVLVTCGSAKEARKIARALVEQRLAACVNILPGHVQSVYRWKGKVESAREFLLITKTTRRRFAALQRAVRSIHSYDTPEMIALPIAAGSQDYLAWIAGSVRAREK